MLLFVNIDVDWTPPNFASRNSRNQEIEFAIPFFTPTFILDLWFKRSWVLPGVFNRRYS